VDLKNGSTSKEDLEKLLATFEHEMADKKAAAIAAATKSLHRSVLVAEGKDQQQIEIANNFTISRNSKKKSDKSSLESAINEFPPDFMSDKVCVHFVAPFWSPVLFLENKKKVCK